MGRVTIHIGVTKLHTHLSTTKETFFKHLVGTTHINFCLHLTKQNCDGKRCV